MTDEEELLRALRHETLYYKAALEIMTAKLQVLEEELRAEGDRSPIDHIQSRLKTPEGIIDKLRRRNAPLTTEAMERHVQDIAGLRIICPFPRDIDRVAEMLLRQPDIQLLRRKDYIAHPKPNGYRSLHLILLVDVHFSDRREGIPVEVQLRTIAMNCWAAVEHQVRYKKDRVLSEAASALLLECAGLMRQMDEKGELLAAERDRDAGGG